MLEILKPIKRTIKSVIFPETFKKTLIRTGISKEFLKRHRVSVTSKGRTVFLTKGGRRIALRKTNLVYLHDLVPYFDLYFSQVMPSRAHGFEYVDFSESNVQTLIDTGLEFAFSSVAEGSIAFSSYIYGVRPKEGDIVLDAGAYCGVSTYFFSKLVGPKGRVVALEPDETSYRCLLQNIERHGLTNVVPIRAALSGGIGKVTFNSEGALGSAISSIQARPDSSSHLVVDTLGISDILKSIGAPKFDYVKMDIEGAEIEALQDISKGQLEDLCENFAIASYHIVNGEKTALFLEKYFTDRGYKTNTLAPYGRPDHGGLITWAQKTPSRMT